MMISPWEGREGEEGLCGTPLLCALLLHRLLSAVVPLSLEEADCSAEKRKGGRGAQSQGISDPQLTTKFLFPVSDEKRLFFSHFLPVFIHRKRSEEYRGKEGRRKLQSRRRLRRVYICGGEEGEGGRTFCCCNESSLPPLLAAILLPASSHPTHLEEEEGKLLLGRFGGGGDRRFLPTSPPFTPTATLKCKRKERRGRAACNNHNAFPFPFLPPTHFLPSALKVSIHRLFPLLLLLKPPLFLHTHLKRQSRFEGREKGGNSEMHFASAR